MVRFWIILKMITSNFATCFSALVGFKQGSWTGLYNEQERVYSSIRSEIWQIFNESEKEKVEKLIMKPFGIKKITCIFYFFFSELMGQFWWNLHKSCLTMASKCMQKNQVSILNKKQDIWFQNLLWRTCGRADVRKKRLIEGAFRSLKNV